ncbi:MAG TPA: hypothetical protein PLX66_02595 [Bacilli bacterium]|nr:hypothetical protein [Bacilli bacterium]
MKKIILNLLIISSIFIISNVEAQENYYVNDNNVAITKEDYNYLLNDYSKEAIAKFTDSDLKIVLAKDYQKIGSIDKYYKTTYKKDEKGNVLKTSNIEVSKEDYDNGNIETKSSCGTNCVYYETTYKKLTLTINYGASVSVTRVDVKNEWKRIPSVKLYDIIGFKITSSNGAYWHFNSGGTYVAKQIYDGHTINYSYDTSSSGNTVRNLNGVGQVMNIVDSTSSSLENTMRMYLWGSPEGLSINASYQHATSSRITKAKAKSASFGSASSRHTILGGTFKYTNRIASYYDGMPGVSLTFTSPF